jgi:hypothetical protein
MYIGARVKYPLFLSDVDQIWIFSTDFLKIIKSNFLSIRPVGEIFRTCPDRPWGPPSLLYNGYRVSFPGVKRPGRGVDHPPSSSAEVKERVELYLSTSRPSWPVLEWTLPLPLPSSGSRVALCGRTDGHTDMTKLVVAFIILRTPLKFDIFYISSFSCHYTDLQLKIYSYNKVLNIRYIIKNVEHDMYL